MANTNKELLNEVATVHRDTTQVIFGGGVLQNRDDTLLSRGDGRGLKIYDDIERDTRAFSVLQKRKMAVIAREWQVDAVSDNAQDTAVADFMRATLKAMPFDRACVDLLDAILKGFAVGEVIWQLRDGKILPARLIARDQRRFVFTARDEGGFDLGLLTRANLFKGEPVPERKFIVHSTGAKDGSPYGLGLGTRLFWPVFFKRQDITFWLTFVDKFASPTPVGKYPAGTSMADQAKLLDALAALATDVGVVIPEGMLVELLEAQRSGSTDAYEKLARYMDEQMSEAVLGETMTTGAASAGLGSNQASVHNEVRVELSKADADLLSDTLNATLITWITELNFPGAQPPRVFRNFEESEDLNDLADRDLKLSQVGYRPTLERITLVYGEGYEAVPVPVAQPFGVRAPAPQFSEVRPKTVAEELTGQMANAAAPPLKVWIERIRDFAERADSLEALRDTLLAAYGSLPSAELSKVMQAGFAVADLSGRFDVASDSGQIK